MAAKCSHCSAALPEGGPLEGLCPACLARAASPLLPAPDFPTIPGYEVVSKIGEGGMGVVYAATQPDLDRTVAVKVLHPVYVSDPRFVQRFLREARSAAEVAHPNVVAIYDAGRSGSQCYIAMEYVEGESLDRILARGPAATLPRSLSVMRQSLEALAAIHRCGIVHRDVKPSNIMICGDRVKLVDFGLARPITEEQGAATTLLSGTPRYLSPEHARGEAVDGRSDLYSLGIVFYEMLAGRHPCPETSPNACLLWHASHETAAVPLRRIVSGLPEAVASVVHRMIAKNRDLRYGSAAAALEALGRSSGPPLELSPVRRVPRRRSRLFPIAVCGAIAALALAIYATGRKSPDSQPPPSPPEKPSAEKKPPNEAKSSVGADAPADRAARKLVDHVEGKARLDPDDLRAVADLLKESRESEPARLALKLFGEHASALVRGAEEALDRGDWTEGERFADRLGKDYAVPPWSAQVAKLRERTRALRSRKEGEAEHGKPPPSAATILGTPESITLKFAPSDGALLADGVHGVFLDRTNSEIVKVSLENGEETKRVALKRDPVRLDIRDNRLFVACREGGTVTVLDATTIEVVGNVAVPGGCLSAIAAPARDPERVYAADGLRLYGIHVPTGRVVETMEYVPKTTPPETDPTPPVHLCVDPSGSRIYLWRLNIGFVEACTRIDRGGDGTLHIVERFGNPGPVNFDPAGQFLADTLSLRDVDRQETFGEFNSLRAMGFHPDLAFAVGYDPFAGRLFLHDLHTHRILENGEATGMSRTQSWQFYRDTCPVPFRIEIHRSGKLALLTWRLPVLPPDTRFSPEETRRVWRIPLAPERHSVQGRLGLASPPPRRAEVGYSLLWKAELTGSLAPGATVRLEQGPEGMKYEDPTRTLSWTPAFDQRGTFPVRLALSSASRVAAFEISFRVHSDLRTVDWTAYGDLGLASLGKVIPSRDGKTVYCQEGRYLLVYDVAGNTHRIVDCGGGEILDAADVGSRLCLLTRSSILAVDSKTGKVERVTAVPPQIELWPDLTTARGSFPLFFQACRDISEALYYRVSAGASPQRILSLPERHDPWMMDEAGTTLYGVDRTEGEVTAIRVSSKKVLWSRKTLSATPVERLEFLSDGTRLICGDSILSVQNGDLVRRFEGFRLSADPAGDVVAAYRKEEVRLFRDRSFEEIGGCAVQDLRSAHPRHKAGIVILESSNRFSVLPYDFGRK